MIRPAEEIGPEEEVGMSVHLLISNISTLERLLALYPQEVREAKPLLAESFRRIGELYRKLI